MLDPTKSFAELEKVYGEERIQKWEMRIWPTPHDIHTVRLWEGEDPCKLTSGFDGLETLISGDLPGRYFVVRIDFTKVNSLSDLKSYVCTSLEVAFSSFQKKTNKKQYIWLIIKSF